MIEMGWVAYQYGFVVVGVLDGSFYVDGKEVNDLVRRIVLRKLVEVTSYIPDGVVDFDTCVNMLI